MHLRTVDNTVYNTFEEVCRASNLLIDDKQWEDTLREVCLFTNPCKLRELFAIIVVYCYAANPMHLWETFKNEMSEDICYRHQEIESNNESFNITLIDIEEKISSASNGKSMADYGLPTPHSNNTIPGNQQYFRETHYDCNMLETIIENGVPKLNTEHQYSFDTILNDIEKGLGQTHYLDAPGGTGKTFLLNLLLAKVRVSNSIALGVASSGIAATLILNGCTAHSAFRLPLDLAAAGPSSVCNVSKNSTTVRILKECKLIIWDEVTMSHKYAFEALHRSLCDIWSNDALMGGVTMLLTGDFCQTLPVIPRSTRADTVNACLKYSTPWLSIYTLPPLKTNMRLKDGNNEFAKILETIGSGIYPNTNSYIDLSNICTIMESLEELIHSVWGVTRDIVQQSHEWLSERAILSPRNSSVNKINHIILDGIDSPEIIYKSCDRTSDEADAVQFPIEFLESIEDLGLPPHELKLKIGVPIILIRNIKLPQLCNGTRLVVTALGKTVVQAIILTGVGTGKTVFTPRIPLTSANVPFSFVRLQFPIKLCFSLSVNKSQGQTY